MKAAKTIVQWLDDAMSIVVPDTCEICGRTLTRAERRLCLGCMVSLPRTNVHRAPTNRISERLAVHLPGVRLASWFVYRRGSAYAELIHSIKYADRPKMGREMGRMFAEELMQEGWFDGIDVMLPVPMHWLKQARRGYNQSREIARGVSAATGIGVGTNLYARMSHSTQTALGLGERIMNITPDMFGVRRPEELAGRHVLLVDDVITTGATTEGATAALCRAVNGVAGCPAPPFRLSVLSLALTSIT